MKSSEATFSKIKSVSALETLELTSRLQEKRNDSEVSSPQFLLANLDLNFKQKIIKQNQVISKQMDLI